MTTMRRSRALRGGLLLLLIAAVPPPAGGSVSASLAPPYIEKALRPGRQLKDTISYTNNGNEPVTVSVSVVDFDVSETSDVIEQSPGTRPTTLAPYLRITPTRMTVAPQQQVFFRYAVRAPEEFTHMREMIYFLTRPQIPASAAPRVVFAARMGVPLYVENPEARPALLQVVGEPRWERSGERGEALTLKLTITNEGERIIRPSGFLQVRSADGSFDKAFRVNEGKVPVLPGSTQRLEMSFGPVPGSELSLRLNLEDSIRTTWKVESTLPAFGG